MIMTRRTSHARDHLHAWELREDAFCQRAAYEDDFRPLDASTNKMVAQRERVALAQTIQCEVAEHHAMVAALAQDFYAEVSQPCPAQPLIAPSCPRGPNLQSDPAIHAVGLVAQHS